MFTIAYRLKESVSHKKRQTFYCQLNSKIYKFYQMKVQYENHEKIIGCCFGNFIFEQRDSHNMTKMTAQKELLLKHQKFDQVKNTKTNISINYFKHKQKQFQEKQNLSAQKTNTITLSKNHLPEKLKMTTKNQNRAPKSERKIDENKLAHTKNNRFIPQTLRQPPEEKRKILFENIDVKTILSQSFEESKQLIRLEQSVILLDFFNGPPPTISHKQQKNSKLQTLKKNRQVSHQPLLQIQNFVHEYYY